MISRIEAIISLNPEAEATQMADGSLVWHKNPTNITDEQITTKQAELQTDYDNKVYARKRALAYPTIEDQLDMQYWDKINSTTTWQDAIAKVKSDNPKS